MSEKVDIEVSAQARPMKPICKSRPNFERQPLAASGIAKPINRTNSGTLLWRLAFSRDVENVTSGDSELSGTGLGAVTPTVSAKTGSQRIYDIGVTSGLSAFDGEVTLDFASAQDIQDVSERALDTTWPTHAERTYTLDRTAPAPTISPSKATGSPFVATIDFGEDVWEFGDVDDVTATNVAVGAVSRSDGNTYTVQVTPTATTATTITLSVPANAARDAAGNLSSAASQAVAYDPSTSASLTGGGYSNGSTVENAEWTSATPSVAGTPVGAVAWTKEGADADHFTIDSATGVLSLPARDFEQPADADGDNVYEVTARATDTEGNSATGSAAVTVTDAVEGRTLRLVGARSRTLPETQSICGESVLASDLSRRSGRRRRTRTGTR